MNQPRDEAQLLPLLVQGGRSLRALGLRAMGETAFRCAYCASMIPVGDVQCSACGATATREDRQPDEDDRTQGPWVTPLLLCFFFPPALLIICPILFWRWLRKRDRGWIIPSLICLAFPPAVLLVAPALLRQSQRAGSTRSRR